MDKPTTQTQDETNAAAIKGVKAIFEEWTDERDRLYSLLAGIEYFLRPEDGEDSPQFNAWKLAQVAQDLAADTRNILLFKKQWGLS